MAHKKAGGASRLGRDSQSKRLGTKRSDGQAVNAGEILVRQRGTKIHPGNHVRRGADDTLYAVVAGTVKFTTRKLPNFIGVLRSRTSVNIVPIE
ncbi:TPA: 50S ribosomal protein L27 [Candidatus Uhrbacteria bacterium]|nr:50S ribosomal protein L27 [Candidatus Uhrbacteria bacterium]